MFQRTRDHCSASRAKSLLYERVTEIVFTSHRCFIFLRQRTSEIYFHSSTTGPINPRATRTTALLNILRTAIKIIFRAERTATTTDY